MIVHGTDKDNVIRPLLVNTDGGIGISVTGYGVLSPVGSYYKVENTSLPAGNSQEIVVVLASTERMILRQLTMQYIGTVAGVIVNPRLYFGPSVYSFSSFYNLTSGIIYGFSPNIIIEGSYTIDFNIFGATAGDVFRGYAFMDRIG